jgi:hypothetical protein
MGIMVIGITGIIVTSVAVVGTGEEIAEAVVQAETVVPAAVRTAGRVAEGGPGGLVVETGGPEVQVEEIGDPEAQGQVEAAGRRHQKNKRIEIIRKSFYNVTTQKKQA